MSEEIENFLRYLSRLPPYEGVSADEIWVDEIEELEELIKKSEEENETTKP